MCAKHQKERAAGRTAQHTEHRADLRHYFDAPAWRDRLRPRLFSCGNIQCQALDPFYGRCPRPTVIWHHLIDPASRPDLVYDPRNLVGLCRQHHPNTPGETDLASARQRYAPTLWMDVGGVAIVSLEMYNALP